MVIDSRNTEWGYELVATLPYTYWHHINGTLKGTVSAAGSRPMYFFSHDHRINMAPRDFANTAAAAKDIPNMWIHKAELDESQWAPPPLADHYRERAIVFGKPTVVVYNRYNMEWGKPPINFFDLPTLRTLFDALSPKYDIVYFNVRGEEALEDNAHSMDLGDYEMIRSEFPQVRIIHDLVREHGEEYNTVQLRVFAGCRRFITMNGAPSILASYFGGENIIYTKKCREITPGVGSFYGWYHKFNPSDPSHIRVVGGHDELIETVRMAWVDERPLLNILVRCHDRPIGIRTLLNSVAEQRGNIRVIASYDTPETLKYLSGHPVTRIKVSSPEMTERPAGSDYKGWLGANCYLNDLMGIVTSGEIMFLDDDDVLLPGAYDTIIENSDKDSLLLWKALTREGKTVPDDDHFGQIEAGSIAGIATSFHHSHKGKARWTPWRRGDYRFIKDMSRHIRPKFIDAVLTAMEQRKDPPKRTSFREVFVQRRRQGEPRRRGRPWRP